MHLTRFTIHTESEGQEFKIELTPDETRFVMRYVHDLNTLVDYLDSINKWEKTT